MDIRKDVCKLPDVANKSANTEDAVPCWTVGIDIRRRWQDPTATRDWEKRLILSNEFV